ncbi:MAG: tRNA (N6-threonylcarbamoyladenosine(37)-N6)-methyltransferase TrmO [Candidatus Bathyarchaeia archaeon]|jgi:tRNA-Thr(GGU) m(6)t(6)A37 methyltransferase TsaA
MRAVTYDPIGVIHSPLKTSFGAPLQSVSAKLLKGTVEVFPKYVSGLKDLTGFSHLILIYHFHLSTTTSLIVKPYLDNEEHGIFATRAPARPNPIGISIVRLRKIRAGTIYVQDLDVIDGTPLLDIKPYVPQFDARRVHKIGWLDRNISKLQRTRSDGRFTKNPLPSQSSSSPR